MASTEIKTVPGKETATRRQVEVTGLADALSTYMPTGTISAFLVLSQLVSDGGKCHYKAREDGSFIEATNTVEVVFMALIIGLLASACFVTAFLKREVHTSADRQVTTYRFVSRAEFLGQEGQGTWFSSPRLWVHALMSTIAFLTWSLTSVAATSCFYNLPTAVTRSLSPVVAFICGVVFLFLGHPSPDVFRFDDLPGFPSSPTGQAGEGGPAGAGIQVQVDVAPEAPESRDDEASAVAHETTNGRDAAQVNESSGAKVPPAV